MSQFAWLGEWWAVGLILLLNSLWIVVLGGAAYLLRKLPFVYSQLPAGRGIRAGFAAISVVIAGLIVSHQTESASVTLTALFLTGTTILLFGIGIYFKRGHSWRAMGREVLVFAATFTILFLTGGIAYEMYGSLHNVAEAFGLINALSGETSSTADALTIAAMASVMVLATLAGPATILIVTGIRSLLRRVPLTAGITNGMKTAALPCAGIVLLLYSLTITATWLQEQRIGQAMRQNSVHEGRYLASQTGQHWPGFVDATPEPNEEP